MAVKAKIIFNEEAHTYIVEESGKELIPVSTVIHEYVNPFDPSQATLEKHALLNGCTIEQLLAKWKANNKVATDKGTLLHKVLQDFIEHEITDTEHSEWIVEFIKLRIFGQLYCEKQVYSVEYGVCGTVDVIEALPGAGYRINIYDFKTNKKLVKENKFKNMKGFLSCFSDCNWNHYQLQMSLYAIMAELHGATINSLTLLYLNPETLKIESHPVKYLKELALKMLEEAILNNKNKLIET